MNQEIYQKNEVIFQSRLIAENYKEIIGTELISGDLNGKELSKELYLAPFVVVSHGTEDDPIFNYANLTAQKLWQYNWDEFTKMPSAYSVHPDEKTDRETLLENARNKGYINNYTGIRIARNGKKFYIENVLLFNLYLKSEALAGQCAIFHSWKFI